MPDAGKFTDQIRVNEPFSMPHVTIMDAKTAYNYVLKMPGYFPKEMRWMPVDEDGEDRKAIYVKDAPELLVLM